MVWENGRVTDEGVVEYGRDEWQTKAVRRDADRSPVRFYVRGRPAQSRGKPNVTQRNEMLCNWLLVNNGVGSDVEFSDLHCV